MKNKMFLVKTNGFASEFTYVIVAKTKEEANNMYLAYREEHVACRGVYSKMSRYRHAFDVKTIIEVPLKEPGILHFY